MLVKVPRIATAIMTTIVESFSSDRVGQVARFSSIMVSLKKIRILRNGFFMEKAKVAGQEGLEPPTDGFGDRYSTN